MANFTPFYNVAMFDFADRLDYAINVKHEMDRFLLIDKQIYGLYSIFGDGIISGWEVFDNGFSSTGGISIGINTGTGIIEGLASQTTVTEFLESLSSNNTFYIYAILSGSTPQNREVTFITSSSITVNGGILLAKIKTLSSGIDYIDNTVRTLVSFEQVATDAVNTHKHRGLPSKIDINLETKNELSGGRLVGFDASKITSGFFNEDKFPTLNHNNLTNSGNLTHAQLDTFVNTLSVANQVLFGEITTSNFLEQTIFLKYKDPDIDKYFVNEIVLIPGVSSDSLIDQDASSALIDTVSQCIVGLPTTSINTYFFTTNQTLPDKVKNVILVSHKSIPYNSDIVFGINTTNSVDFNDYQIITEEKLNAITTNPAIDSNNLRIGIKFEYNGPYDVADPYNLPFTNFVEFSFTEPSGIAIPYHFRIRWYTDPTFLNLYHTAYSQSNQNGWLIDDVNPIPSTGYEIMGFATHNVSFYPDLSLFTTNQVYYLVIDAWNGAAFVSETSNYTFVTTEYGSTICDVYGYLPQVKNFALIFELENDKKITLNL